jgi:aspartokinase/homoserine dehydrogenase 1
MIVLKFGGSSVANAEAIDRTRKIVEATTGSRVVVVSALGGITDSLLESGKQAALKQEEYRTGLKEIEDRHLNTIRLLISPSQQAGIIARIKNELNILETLLDGAFLIGETTPKLMDKILSYGELLSAIIVAEYYQSKGLDARFKDSREWICTNDNFGQAGVLQQETANRIKSGYSEIKNEILVMPGFIAATQSRETTTLGRGGSDYSAAIFAGSLGAEELQIWTDVSGMYTANPKWVTQARPISIISYEEAMELSHFGAKVLYPPTIQPALEAKIPIRIKNTFDPEAEGTLIHQEGNTQGKTVRGISHVPDIGLLSLEGPGMIGIAGISKRFFETLADEGINVIFITQASSEHSICAGVMASEIERACKALNKAFAYELEKHLLKPVQWEGHLSIIALVGDQMKEHQGLSGKMFSALGRNNVNIRAIAQGASERNISAVIQSKDVQKALNTLHEAFFEEQLKQLNLFIMGVGNVGSRLLAQINRQKEVLKEQLGLQIQISGISNSRKMLFAESGLDTGQWQDSLNEGETADLATFAAKVADMNLRNSIFIDNTASDLVSKQYESYLKNSISVVTCNKIACSSDYENYENLKILSRRYNAPFLFETNVGAGLPVIDTLKNLILSGDRVLKIQAVLSGSLNFIFNTFNEANPFHEVVQKAMKEGYTEPDPKIDLSGLDVMRKILILARESGFKLELSDIENRSFLPEGALEANSTSEFLKILEARESFFGAMLAGARARGCKLRYVANFDKGKAWVGLEEIPETHDFFNLEGKDNVVLFYTDRYPEQPLIIKGAGAGADVTASGLFADIIRIGNF